MGDDSEWMKLPTEEKCTHKVWKARVAGYEEASKLFQRLDDEKSPEFSKYAGLMKKFVTDSNAVAQEKALDAVVQFVENAHVAGRTAGDVVHGIITKCLNASKTKTKEKGMEIIMLYIEAEKQEVVQEQLLAGLENKQPKVVVGCIQALTIALRDFGSKVVQIKPCLKVLPKLLEDRDKNVREETKQFIIELYRWIGVALKPQMSHFKPVQVQELEAEFERLPPGKPVQSRFLRSQQDLKAKMEEQAAAGGPEGDAGAQAAGEVEEIDPFELIEAVDILAKLPKDFFDQIEAKKWQERKEALEALHKLVENPKIENGDFGNLVRALLKVIAKDSNVMLVALGGKCLAGLAKGLRKKFQPYANQCVSTILEKFKEKKAAVVASLREAIDAAFFATTLEHIMEDVIAALENKNPSIRSETASFLARCFAKSTVSTLPKKLLKNYCTSLLKTVNDTTPEVREASFLALGTAMKVVSEKNISPFLVDVDTIKMQKIQENCQNAVLLNARGEPRAGAAAAAPAAAPPKKNEPKPVARPPPKAAAKVPETASVGPAKAKAPAGKKKAADKGKGKKGGAGKEEPTENVLSDEAVEEKAAAALPATVISGLSSSNWKERLAAMETFHQTVKGMSKDEIPTQAFIRTIAKKPGIKDTNFQVLKLKLELIGYLGQNSKFTKTSGEFCLPDMVDKVGDVKNGSICQEALSCITESTSLEYVSREVIRLAFEQKNPKNQSESMNWLAQAIKDFGFKVNIKPMIENIKKALGATNPAVRGAAINLLGVVHLYMGPQLRMFFEDEKAALLQQIDAEFEKNKDQKPPTPTRGQQPVADDEEDEDKDGDAAEEEPSVQDLVPRNDISEKITEALLTEMTDKNWKVRAEALQKVIAILNEAKFITSNIGELAPALKTRLGDANKILVTTTIGICQTLGTAMGPHCKHHIRTIGPGLIGCMADGKPQVRAAAVNALNIWVEHCNLTPLVESEAIYDGLKTENPNLRTELLNWLSEKLPTHKILPPELKSCVSLVLCCLEDRNADVRKKAQESLVPFMIHTGYDSFFKATAKLKPASKDQIMKIIETARGNLPAKAPKAKKAAAAPAPAAAPPSKWDEPEEPPAKTAAKAEPKSKVVKGKGGKAPPPSSRKKEEEDLSPPINLTIPKEQRFKDEKNMKVLKWNFLEVRGEYIEQLRTQMEKNFSKSMMDLLFHNDFKSHIKAITILIKCIETHNDETMGNLDLILKWFTVRFYDTNPSMLNKALECLQKLFSMLADGDYHLHDYEASSFIPYLVLKVGDSKDNVRREVRKIFKLICKVYPASKMFSHLIEGLRSKNSKQRAECLDELGILIEGYGITICQPSPAHALKIIAGQISDRDNSVRNAALNTVVVAHTILGDGLYKYIGHLAEKDQSLLEERIKRSAKNKPAPRQEERPKTAPLSQKTVSQPNIPRAASAMQKSSSSNSMKREFALDIEAEPANFDMPQLLQLDMDHIYEPVDLPKIKARPPSPSRKLLNSNDASATIGFVISQITSPDISTCIQALVQIDEVLKDEERAEIMVGHADQLLLTLSMQFKMVFSTHMGDEETSKDEVIRLYRCLLGTLLAILQTPCLAKKASKDILKDVVNSLITVLLDSRLMELEEGPQVVRSVNVTVVKIVEKSDHTNIMSALIRLLQDCVSSETCTTKFLDLIMKCLWKMVRMLPTILNDLNIDRILTDCHFFLRAHPSSSWKDKGNDLPLRTVKTILHTLAKLKGNKILYHTGLIENSENSEVEAYLKKVLKNDVAATNAKNDELNDNREKTPKSSSKSKRFSKTTHDMLAEIFKKIGSKENTKEGLNALYDFKKKYPDADLEPFLKKSSQFFQNYIEKGLASIEQERNEKGGSGESGNIPSSSSSSSSLSSSVTRGSGAGGKSSEDPDYYLKRLKILRVKCGLDENEGAGGTGDTEEATSEENNDIDTVIGASTQPGADGSEDDEKQQENIAPEPSAPANPTVPVDVSDLKMRLDRIKKLANKS